MGMGNYSKGWGGADDMPGGGGGGGGESKMTDNERLLRFRFGVPTPNGTDKKPNLVKPGRPATKRVLFLEGEPFCMYEHSLYNFKGAYKDLGTFTANCIGKNGLSDKGCPLCAKNGGNNFPAFIGFFPVIDMGQVEFLGEGKVELHHEYWTDDKGEKHYRAFERVLLGAKRGSQDKPGVLKTLQYKMERYGGDLAGTVWDTTRSGEKSAVVGDGWEFVERVKMEEIKDYLVQHGANEDELKLDVPVFSDEHTQDGIFDVDPVDYYRKLARIVGWGGGDSTQRSDAKAEGAGFDDYEGDGTGGPPNDDISF